MLGDSGSEGGERVLEGSDCEESKGPCVEEAEVSDGGKSLHGEMGCDKLG